MDTVSLIVYGTLMEGEANAECCGQVLSRVPCTLKGTLYDTGCGFPAFVPEGDGSVRGELLTIPADRLEESDRLEGCPILYRREKFSVTLADGTRKEGWIYLMNDLPSRSRVIPSGDWPSWRKALLLEVRWMGINALEFRYPGGSFMIDPYVSRDPEALTKPEEVDKYITGRPDFILMTHAHWDHLPDVPQIIRKTGAVLYASETACAIMRKKGVPEEKLHPLRYGEVLNLPGGVRVTAFESRHMGDPDPRRYKGVAEPDMTKKGDWICGEIFAFLIEINGYRIFNAGSANLHLPAVDGLECDTFFCGISRWKPGFPELLDHIRFRQLIPTHHDEFRKPLSEFSLRNDPERLAEVRPDLKLSAIPVLKFVPVHS